MTTAYCHLCKPPKRMPLGDLAEHLRAEHELDMADAERWPDGEFVVYDSTLESEDFAP